MGDISPDPATTPSSIPPALPGEEGTVTAFQSDVLAEMDRLQNRRASWTQALTVLGVSLLLFLAAGAMQWDRSFLLLIIPILFFHELGHYLAMKWMGYTNLRMFFIPLFGAAVSGQHYNVAAWKQIVVALAGPVPGIVVGALLAVAAVVNANPTLHQIAVLTLILNGFNLLPLLPLDGGHVVRAILFSRHPLLDVGFRASAAIILIVGSLMLGDKLLIIVGVFMLLGLPLAYQSARIVAELRREGLSGASPDAKTIPQETAIRIIDRVHGAMPKLAAKQVASHALAIFQDLNARPPGVGVSLGLGAAHAVAFIAALVFTVGAFVAQAVQSPGFLDQLAGSPVFPLDENAMVLPADPPTPAGTLLVMTLGSTEEAQKEFAADTTGSSPRAQSLFGCSIFVAFDKPVPNEIPGPTSSSFVAVRGEDDILMRLQCLAPTASVAAAIQQQVDAYGRTPDTTSPWTPRAANRTAVPAIPDLSILYQARAIQTSAGGGSLTIQFIADDPHHLAPALTRWLQEQGCNSFRYDIWKQKRQAADAGTDRSPDKP